jgi:hypothetical protein
VCWGGEELVPPIELPVFDPDRPQAPIALSPGKPSKKGQNDSGGLIAANTLLDFELVCGPLVGKGKQMVLKAMAAHMGLSVQTEVRYCPPPSLKPVAALSLSALIVSC